MYTVPTCTCMYTIVQSTQPMGVIAATNWEIEKVHVYMYSVHVHPVYIVMYYQVAMQTRHRPMGALIHVHVHVQYAEVQTYRHIKTI